MTATKSLRQLLDERGVEWWNDTDPEPQHVTVVHFEERIVIYHENVNGTMGYHVYNTHDLTPEQAVEATLGRGTCRKVREWEDDPCGGGGWVLVCSECDELLANDGEDGEFDGPNYCPNCGRKVEP